jgi:ribonuclease Y
MNTTLIYIIITALIALAAGFIAGKLIFTKDHKHKAEEADQQAQKILADAQVAAENLKKEKLLEAKERFVQLKAEHDREVLEKTRKIGDTENRIKQKEVAINQKEQSLDKQTKEIETIKENLNRQTEVVSIKRTELEKHQEEHIRRLEKVAGLTAEEAKSQLIESLKQEAHAQALAIQQEIVDDARQKANKEARKIVIQTIQRTAAEQAIENSITVSTSKAMKSKARSSGARGVTFVQSRQQRVLTLLLTIPRKPLSCPLSIR